jgi:hypothetical protein
MVCLHALRHIGQHGGVANQLPNIPHRCSQLTSDLQSDRHQAGMINTQVGWPLLSLLYN